MKRKQTNASPKVAKGSKAVQKVKPVKVIQEEVEDSDEEEEVPQVEVAKAKKFNNKTAKPKKAVEVVPDDEEEDEVAEEQDEDEDDEVGEEDEEIEEDEEEAEEAEDDDDDDDAPSEEGIGTEEPTIPSKVKSGPISSTVPVAKIVHVTKLPKKCKHINIVEAFAKYGPLEQIHIVTTPGAASANVAYKTEKAALAAAADDKKVKVLDTIVSISIKKENSKMNPILSRDRCVHVKNLKAGITEEQIEKHFASCGEIEIVKLVGKIHAPAYAYVTFANKSAMPAALKLHNSILNDINIKVTANTENKEALKFDESLTIMLKNKQGFESVDASKLQAIFGKCGEIDHMELVCRKQVLAFITFKTEDAAQNSLKLNGKTMQEIELEVEPYSPFRKWTSIHVTNLSKDVTEADLLRHFSKAGEIANIIKKHSFAIVRFTDSDGYCKSFLYNETFLKGQIIFIEPHSNRKQSVIKKKGGFKKGGFKRPNENGNSVFKAKKQRFQ